MMQMFSKLLLKMDGIMYLHNVFADTEKQGMLWAYENAVNTLMWRWNELI